MPDSRDPNSNDYDSSDYDDRDLTVGDGMRRVPMILPEASAAEGERLMIRHSGGRFFPFRALAIEPCSAIDSSQAISEVRFQNSD